MFKCDKCGEILENLPVCKDTITIDGYSYTIQEYGFDECKCSGIFKKAKHCPICNEWFIEEDRDCCDKCFEENLNKETLVDIGYNPFDINDFFRSVFSDIEINEILELEFDKIDEELKKQYYRKFAEEEYNFGEKVAERKRRENLYKRKN